MTSVIFLGTPKFGAVVLQGLIDQGYKIEAVVTQPDKKFGRKQELHQSEVKKVALANNLKIYQPLHLSKSEEMNELLSIRPDFIVTAAYGQFLPTKFLQTAKIKAINVHGSLLPKYRGGAPIQYSLINGDKQTGVTIIEMVKKMDAGEMYGSRAIDISDDDTSGSLFEKLSIIGRDLLLEVIPKIIANQIVPTGQDEDKVVFSPNISKDQEQIKTSMTATQAHNLVRALNPQPGAYILMHNKRYKIWQSEVSTEKCSLESGYLVSKNKEFAISFRNGTILKILNIQPTGKKPIAIKDFINGQGNQFKVGEKIVED